MRITHDIWCPKQGMPVQQKDQILASLRRQQRRLGVWRCGLFDSFVRNESQPYGDVDILAVLFLAGEIS